MRTLTTTEATGPRSPVRSYSNISEETLAKSAGDLFLAPLGTGAPTDSELSDTDGLVAAGWVHVGWLDEDGPNFTGFEGSNSKRYGWNRSTPVRSITRITEPGVEVGLLQWNQENLEIYFPGASYDAGTRTLSIPESGTADDQELLVVVADGARYVGLWAGKVTPRGGGAFNFPGDGLSVIPVVFDIVSTDDPDEWVKTIGVDPAGELAS